SAGGGAGGGGAAGGGASGGGRLPGPAAETSPRLPGEIVDYADQDPKRTCGVDALDLKLSAEYKTDMTKATDAAIAQLEAAGAAGTAAIVAEHAARIRAMQPDGGCR
ncbi:hypothetical protein, partial [Caulobacter sp. 17J80-11]|uniref:hypothetical protein n=1 Tax=Caulobacter sp. 17J80-11 TaxID=2763502 RepID=UPI00199590A8